MTREQAIQAAESKAQLIGYTRIVYRIGERFDHCAPLWFGAYLQPDGAELVCKIESRDSGIDQD